MKRSAILWYNILLYIVFLSQFPWGIGLTFFEIFHLLPYALQKKKLHFFTIAKITLAILLSIFFWNRADIGFQFLSVIALTILNYFIFYEVEYQKLYDSDDLLSIINIKLKNIMTSLVAFTTSPIALPKKVRLSSQAGRILLGVIISVPFVLVLMSLFSSADTTFENWSMSFWNWAGEVVRLEFLQIDIFELVLSGFLFLPYLLIVLPSGLLKDHKLLKHYLVELVTLTAIVGLIFAVFLVSQYKNVQAILIGFQAASLNPREFVREGFYQMAIASGIGFFVIYLIEQDLRKKISEKLAKLGKLSAGILLGEIVAVVALAFQRVWAYQYAYGYTQLRIWGIVLVSWLFGIAFIFGLKLYRFINRTTYVQSLILFSALTALIAGWANVDRMVVEAKPPTINNKVDYGHLGLLSYDAAPVWEEILLKTEGDEYELIRSILNSQGVYYYTDNTGQLVANTQDYAVFYECKAPWLFFSYNRAVNRGKEIVCSHINDWRVIYEDFLLNNSSI